MIYRIQKASLSDEVSEIYFLHLAMTIIRNKIYCLLLILIHDYIRIVIQNIREIRYICDYIEISRYGGH